MAQKTESLESSVLAAYEVACQENDYEIAEHLLRALEVISQREGNEGSVNKAYLTIAASVVRRH